jgi:citrate synthase
MADMPAKDLADIIATSTALGDIDGRAGPPLYRGYDTYRPAGSATFEEIAYLRQRGHLIWPDSGYLGERGLTRAWLGRR